MRRKVRPQPRTARAARRGQDAHLVSILARTRPCCRRQGTACNAIAMDMVPRISRAQKMDASSMANIATVSGH